MTLLVEECGKERQHGHDKRHQGITDSLSLGWQAGLVKRACASAGGAMSPGRAPPQRRLRYTWGDVALTLTSGLFTLYAMGKAEQLAEQGGSLVPFWVAYAAGLAAAACWLGYYARRHRAVRRSRAAGGSRRTAIALATSGLVIVGLGLVEAFAAVGLQAVVFGATARGVTSTLKRNKRRCRVPRTQGMAKP